MCLAVPMIIREIRGETGRVEEAGVSHEVSLALFPEARAGDHVLVHAGFVIQRLDEDEARETLAIFEELRRAAAEGGA